MLFGILYVLIAYTAMPTWLNCQFYTPGHPILPEERNGTKGPECGTAITIGEDSWLGGSVIVLGGVTIGNGVTVGARAVW
jgi:maltose O-acetyltransferase